MKVRFADAGDDHAAAGLMAQLAEHSHGRPDPGVEDRFRAMLASSEYALWVAEDENGRLAGLLSASRRWTLWHAGPCAIIEELVVDRGARGRGIGRALIQAALGWARAAGCSEVEVSTDVDNTAAQAFYRRLGFDHEALTLEIELEGRPTPE